MADSSPTAHTSCPSCCSTAHQWFPSSFPTQPQHLSRWQEHRLGCRWAVSSQKPHLGLLLCPCYAASWPYMLPASAHCLNAEGSPRIPGRLHQCFGLCLLGIFLRLGVLAVIWMLNYTLSCTSVCMCEDCVPPFRFYFRSRVKDRSGNAANYK